jgi:hypothetical protein
MFKRKKNKTGVQTPEFRKPTPPPSPPTSGSNAVKPNPNYVPPASVKKPCPYELPCGWCTKWDKKCDKKIGHNETIVYLHDDQEVDWATPDSHPHTGEHSQ